MHIFCRACTLITLVLILHFHFYTIHFYMCRELWQGQRWMTDPLYYAGSAEILNEEVYPGYCIAFQHRTLDQVMGCVKKVFTTVSLSA